MADFSNYDLIEEVSKIKEGGWSETSIYATNSGLKRGPNLTVGAYRILTEWTPWGT